MKCEFCNRRKARYFWEQDSVLLGKDNEISTSEITIAKSCQRCLPQFVEGAMDESEYKIYQIMNA